jgi:hypothetical protein
MASSSKRKTTMAKLNRERKLQERRVLKQAKKEARRREAAEAGASQPENEADQVATESAPGE